MTWDAALVFGQAPDDLTAPAQRNCTMQHPDQVASFKTYCVEQFQHRRLFQALDKLIHKFNRHGKWTKKMTKTYNVLDAAATEIMNQGDAQCVTKKKFTMPWSVLLICASALLHYWSIKISSLKRRSVSLSVLQDAAARGGV